jgi:hypothetical protein
MNMKNLYVVLMTIEHFERKQAEAIEDQHFDDFSSLQEHLEETNVDGYTDASLYTMTDFMEACNDQEIDLEQYWISYVHIDKPL